jgi:hemerythrin-like domain-containing protein
MTTPIDQLKEQHLNIARLLRLIERELEKVSSEGTPNVSLLLDIMQYLTRYVDVAHHPLEELLIERVEQSEESANGELAECKRQHKSLADLGRSFSAVVEAVREEQLVERTQFASAGHEFVNAQLAHISLEESKVFPTLKRALNDEEMIAIGEEMESSRDPLFGGIVEKEYQQLYDYIIRSA